MIEIKHANLYSVSLAATWDREVIAQVGKILIDECRSKEVDVLLGPTGTHALFLWLYCKQHLTIQQKSAYLAPHLVVATSKHIVKIPF